ncbi:alpha-hydroxy acid oxidase [Aidingimonas halophila]|uniref:L-lactate dehydrogenase (Cytochrome) n=1 Tax=Aidingimonas halophila TaxID=574349 RepID=A0A1H2X7H3_9GAMM|nr:alpha-hydroxy acid oxidase [Aidingimonas halophila]SDW88862.1 L-lactate dehydrogenase (cytochrome) [Aidingimonas halophila]
MTAVDTSRKSPVEPHSPDTAIPARQNVPRGMRGVVSLDDLEARARRHLPVPIFGYIAGQAESGAAYTGNRSAFEKYLFSPNVLRGTKDRDQSVGLFGRRYSRPFGIAPMGLSALAAYDGDIALANGAYDRDTVAILSATSLTPLERVAKEGPSHWFQAYFPGDHDRVRAMVERIAAAGFETLVVTVDVPVNGNREIDKRNRFVTPIEPTPKLFLQGATRPAWSFGTAFKTLMRHGMPRFANLDVGEGPPIVARNIERSFSGREAFAWEHLETARKHWKGNLVLKGVLRPDDAIRALDVGCDGLIVSSHGGRQLDSMIAPLDALPGIRAAVGPNVPVLIDSGLRRGTEVLKALALGADFAFVGRPFLYAAALAGRPGVTRAFDILSEEVDRNMAMIGLQSLSGIRDANGNSHFVLHRSQVEKEASAALDSYATEPWHRTHSQHEE